MKQKLFIILCGIGLSVGSTANAQSGKVKSLFTPNNKNEWHTFIEGAGKNNDPLQVFKFEKNVLHASGERFGYVITEKSYSNFHLSLEFKWGEKKYPPREKDKRDGGVLYHSVLYSGDKIWPRSLEFQIQEGDCGDFWLTDSVTMTHADTLTKSEGGHRVVKTKNAEKPNGQWNKVEVIVKDGIITHKLNGEVVNTGKNPSVPGGQIVLQSEGAEIYYRDIKLEEL
ncbi:MAG: hypothetical protein JWN56_1918 [Sphingobacteriales bacterium]|nr:hypothetical protein [Sphingobacteriales bacterium]